MTTPASTTIRRLAATVVVSLALLGCASSDDETATATETDQTGAGVDSGTPADTAETGTTGIRLVSAAEGAAILDDPPDDLVVLDVRTAEEFSDGHLAGAIMLDFYAEDFADQLAGLDPEVPYVLYCRSGNRSGQTRALMEDLGFTDVADVDGGILAWADAGLPVEG